MNRTLLLFGWKPHSIHAIRRAEPEAPLLVIEEPSLKPREPIAGAEYVPARYQQSTEAVETARALADANDIAAVVPLREYTTPAANAAAAALRLPRLGDLAAQAFRDKMVLRQTVSAAAPRSFAQPRFASVRSGGEAAEFVKQNGQAILKPSNRQSTVGIFRVSTPTEAAAAYSASLAAEEPGRIPDDRDLDWHHQIETFIEGREYSTELFFDRGRAIFANCTRKRTHAGSTPYETGHMVPLSRLDGALHRKLVDAAEELAAICQVGSGAMHAEWLIRDGTVYLVESAGRPPGCFITDLIGVAHGIDYFALLLSVLTREPDTAPLPACRTEPGQFCAMRWFDPEPGRVLRTRSHAEPGARELRLLDYAVTAREGQLIALANNHTRVGHAIAAGPDAAALEAYLDAVADNAVLTVLEGRVSA